MATVHEDVIDGHLVRARRRRKPLKPGSAKGYMIIEVEVYAGEEKTPEPFDVWEMPKELPFHLAAETAVRQTDFEEKQ